MREVVQRITCSARGDEIELGALPCMWRDALRWTGYEMHRTLTYNITTSKNSGKNRAREWSTQPSAQTRRGSEIETAVIERKREKVTEYKFRRRIRKEKELDKATNLLNRRIGKGKGVRKICLIYLTDVLGKERSYKRKRMIYSTVLLWKQRSYKKRLIYLTFVLGKERN